MHILVKKLIIHLLLLQSYVNDDTIYLGLNAPSWFLSTYVFLQLMLIPITRILRKVKNKKVFFFIFITIFVLNAIYINVIHNLNYDITYWLYVFPPARLPEFICGIVTGMVFSKNKSEDFLCDSKKIKKYTIVELICVFLLLALIYIVNLETIFEPWMSRTEFWILPLTFIIYVFANEKGYISNILKASCFEKLSSISHECFMLHIPVVCVFNMLNLMWASRRIRFIIWWAILFTTICVSVIWKYLYGLIKSKKYAEFKDAKFRNRVDKSDKR